MAELDVITSFRFPPTWWIGPRSKQTRHLSRSWTLMPVNLVSGFIAPFIFPKFRFCPMPALHTTEPAAWHVRNVFAFLIRFLEGGLKTPFPTQSQVFTLNKEHLIKKLAVGNGDPSCLSRR